jgi:hypothetical protein
MVLSLIVILLIACENYLKPENVDNSAINNFNVIWRDFNQNYPLFDHYHVNWQDAYDKYVDRIEDTMSSEGSDFNDIVSFLLLELHDHHVYLMPHSFAFEAFLKNNYDTYFYDIDQVKKYIDTNAIVFNDLIFYAGRITSEYTLNKNIYYVRIKTFLVEKNDEMYSAIDSIFNFLVHSDASIFDIRNNGGGYSYLRDEIASRIVKDEIHYAYEQYRNGRETIDLTERQALILKPGLSEKYRKPIALLVNRLSASASEYFTLQLKLAGNVIIIGDTTSGTLSHIEQKRLPNGWRYHVPVSKMTTLDGRCLEGIGIAPDIHIAQTGASKDTVFFKALEILCNQL